MKNEPIRAYFMRVDRESGVPYRGYSGTIEDSLAAKQRYVNFDEEGGCIQVLHLGDDIVAVCHDGGKVLGFPANREWLDDDGEVVDVLAGNILALRRMGEELVGISESDIPYIEEHLRPAILLGGGIVVRIPDDGLPEYREG